MTLTLTINGAARALDVDPEMPLLWALRDILKLKGTKFGCGIAACGACTVLVDGVQTRACVTPVGSITGAVTTIEGLAGGGLAGEGVAADGVLHAVQRAWVELNVAQCGYCQSGQIMAAVSLLTETPEPSSEEVTAALDGNLCRCGTYPKIRAGIARAVELIKAEA
jgi:isoquinoline 1-oxidoreductase subunit alpha